MKKTFSLKALLILIFATTFSGTAIAQDFRPWMHKDIKRAWKQKYQGQRTRIITVDEFIGGTFSGRLGRFPQTLSHGDWVSMQSSMVAPRAQTRSHDFSNTNAIKLSSKRTNIVNLSYGMIGAPGLTGPMNWSARENSIISAARDGTAVVVQAAGNHGNNMGEAFVDQFGQGFDYLSRDLAGLPTTIFVGAVHRNGTKKKKARITAYSARAGYDPDYYNRFLVVGVREKHHGLAGTSFAAPVVSGYAAIVSSKFRKASPEAVTNQLLNTARTNRIRNYDLHVHGRGEASLRRALAPRSIR